LEENQGACYWGVKIDDIKDEKATVYVCGDIKSDGAERFNENISLESFLIAIIYHQAAQGGYEYAAAIYKNDYENIEEYSQNIAAIVKDYEKALSYGRLVIYQKRDKLIWYDEGNADMIFCATRTKEGLEELKERGFCEL
jgi:hypothetical protein